MSKKQILIGVGIAIVFGAGGFFGGMQYQKSKAPAGFGNLTAAQRAQFAQRAGAAGATAGAGRRGGSAGGAGGFAAGQILSKDDKSITISLMGGGSKIVYFATSTQISKPAPVQPSDLATGQNVIVSGSANSDGSVTAQTIQIRENMAPSNQAQPQ